jgi:hypothetical protein
MKGKKVFHLSDLVSDCCSNRVFPFSSKVSMMVNIREYVV